MKKWAIYLYLACVPAVGQLWATTETFEAESVGSSSFSEGGETFSSSSSSGTFDVFDASGAGVGPSDRFLDNTGSTGFNLTFSLTKSSGQFNVSSLYGFFSDASLDITVSGSAQFIGKLGGVTQFTVTKNSGFNTSFGVDNGFTFIDFSTEGGSDNTGVDIDELEIVLSGSYAYLAVDDFSFSVPALPVNLIQWQAEPLGSSAVRLNWTTGQETNNEGVEVQHATQPHAWEAQGFVPGLGTDAKGQTYTFEVDALSAQSHYFRLKQIDFDGQTQYSQTLVVDLSTQNQPPLFYPVPTKDKLYVQGERWQSARFELRDVEGRSMGSGRLEAGWLDLAALARGRYFLTLRQNQERWTQSIIKR